MSTDPNVRVQFDLTVQLTPSNDELSDLAFRLKRRNMQLVGDESCESCGEHLGQTTSFSSLHLAGLCDTRVELLHVE